MDTETGQFGHEEPRHKHPSKLGPGKWSQHGQPEASQEKWDDGCCVFISNLAFTLQDPEERLRTVFQTCGTVKEVRPIFSGQGTFRGYCYVQFQDTLAVIEALKLDRQELDGRPMFVSPSIDKKKNQDQVKVSACIGLYTNGFRKW